MKRAHFPLKAVVLLSALLLPGGCVTLQSNEPPPATYVLHPRFGDAPVMPASDAPVVEIPAPGIPAGFDTDKIALYWDQGRRLDYYAAARWPEPLDRLLGDFILRAAQQSLPGAIAVSENAGIPSAYRLAIKVTEFQPVYKRAPSGIPDCYAALRFSLIAMPGERIVTDFTVSEVGSPASDSLTDITKSMESIMQSALAQGFERLSPLIAPPPVSPPGAGLRPE